jgi:hypothetical protein
MNPIPAVREDILKKRITSLGIFQYSRKMSANAIEIATHAINKSLHSLEGIRSRMDIGQ